MRIFRNALVLLFLVGFTTGCVTRGQYDQQQQETQRQQQRADLLEDDVDYLLEQLAALEEGKELSDATVDRLEATVRDLTEKIEQLEESREILRSAKNEEIEDLKAELGTVREERDQLQQKLARSQQQNETLNQTTDELRNRLNENQERNKGLQDELADLRQANESLRSELNAVRNERDRLNEQANVSTLDAPIRFKSASAELTAEHKRTLDGLVNRLSERGDRRIVVVGHSDNVPIASAPFSSNWSLSAQRASAVVEYLTETTSLDPSRFVVEGRGPYDPAQTPGENARDKQYDRRVQIKLAPR